MRFGCGDVVMSLTGTPAGWYPDPGRAHELRFFDGNAWTDHVSDNGQVTEAALGPVPPGLLNWFPPLVMAASATASPRPVDTPRAKMWILAVLSALIFWLHMASVTIILPLGVLFAIWCWRVTAKPLTSHQQASSSAATEIKAARWVAVALAIFSLAQVAIWSR